MKLFLNDYKALFHFTFFNYNIVISDFTLTILMPFIVLISACFFIKKTHLPNLAQGMVEYAYEYLYEKFGNNFEESAQKFVHFLISLFLFILTLNIVNLIPFCMACTGELSSNLSLSWSVILLILFLIMRKFKFKFWKFFIPPNLPLFLKPVLFLIEFITFFIRPFSLALRLTINVIVGHFMLDVIASLATGYISLVMSFAILTFLSIFELGMAAIQAYVFVTLSSVYLAEILNCKKE